MGKKQQKGEENANTEESQKVEKEGENLLGAPKFKKLENGRFKCVETGHELPAHAKESYAQTKHCRLGLVDSFLARSKPPLNMFEQDPLSRSKLKCKLTGLTVNKSEEHIWKHINGKRFLNMLEKKEAEKETPNGTMEGTSQEKPDVKEKEDGLKKKKKKEKKKKKKIKKQMEEDEENASESEMRKPSDEAEEVDFWIPPSGERWDFDDGGERWGSGSDSGSESDDASGAGPADCLDDGNDVDADNDNDVDGENNNDAKELSKKGKRMSVEIEPDNCMPSNKKNKTKFASQD